MHAVAILNASEQGKEFRLKTFKNTLLKNCLRFPILNTDWQEFGTHRNQLKNIKDVSVAGYKQLMLIMHKGEK